MISPSEAANRATFRIVTQYRCTGPQTVRIGFCRVRARPIRVRRFTCPCAQWHYRSADPRRTRFVGVVTHLVAQQACSHQPQTFSRFAAFAPRGALHGAVLTIHGCDLTRSAVPVFPVPTVGLTLSLPQRIGTRCDLLVFLLIHDISPFSQIETNVPLGLSANCPGLQPGSAC